jgi:hypothetical protein
VFVLVGILLFGDARKSDAGTPVCARALFGRGVRCAGGVSAGNGGAPGEVGPARGRAAAPAVPLTTVTDIGSVNGQVCTFTAAVTPAERAQDALTSLSAVAGPLPGLLLPCPLQPGTRLLPVSPVLLAERFWYTARLPVPRPSSRPDYAVTGKPTYLQAGDTNTPPPWTRATPLGPLRITAVGTYTVDWGDATAPTGPYTTPGGPFPTGLITHTYDSVGTVVITVREDWTATWTIGAAHGTLTDLHTTGTLPDFAVRQIQAVITG